MNFKQRRESNHLSQEMLSEMCGLSLRTIQRAESGHRVSYASLRSLATVFDINVDQLERELYAMENIIKEYKDYPFWVRFACGRGWFSASKKELQKIELFALFFAFFAGSIWLSCFIWELPFGQKPLFNISMADLFGLSSIGCLFSAYNYSIAIRVGDKYDLWSKLEATQPGGIFGFFNRKEQTQP